MANSLLNPGDVLEGQGTLLDHGRLIAHVDYHLIIPGQIHFLINPSGKLRPDYKEYAGGFILLTPEDAEILNLSSEYTLELATKHKKTIRVERRYKKVKHKGKPRISFWVKVIDLRQAET